MQLVLNFQHMLENINYIVQVLNFHYTYKFKQIGDKA